MRNHWTYVGHPLTITNYVPSTTPPPSGIIVTSLTSFISTTFATDFMAYHLMP